MRALIAMLAITAIPAAAATPADLQAQYATQARAENPAFGGFSADRGRAFFGAKHGRDWSCATCHGATPTAAGKHATTGKAIAFLLATR